MTNSFKHSGRTLVVGGRGRLGTAISKWLRARGGDVIPATRSVDVSDSEIQLVLDRPLEMVSTLNYLRPSHIFYCAGRTNVEDCELDGASAIIAHSTAPQMLARWCRLNGARFVYFSTDQLFSVGFGPFTESDRPAPCNNYGWSKAIGEAKVLIENENALIIRCSFFGNIGNTSMTFSEYVASCVEKGNPVVCSPDVIFNPIHIHTLLEVLDKVLSLEFFGILHVSSDHSITKREFIQQLTRHLFGYSYDYINCQVSGIVSRPSSMYLSNALLKKRCQIDLPTLEHQITLCGA